MLYSTTSAILFIVFNRPSETSRVLERIRRARPSKLYVAADGPRAGRGDDVTRCAEVRSIVSEIDWDCTPRYLLRDSNLGCRRAVTEAIDWFFGEESEGIILEDDCLAKPEFFAYADEMLGRFRNDDRVGVVAGHNVGWPDVGVGSETNVFLSRYACIWGWATWARVWSRYRTAEQLLMDPELRAGLERACLRRWEPAHWISCLQRVACRGFDTWDYQLLVQLMLDGRGTLVPALSLVSNIGTAGGVHHCDGLVARMEAARNRRIDRRALEGRKWEVVNVDSFNDKYDALFLPWRRFDWRVKQLRALLWHVGQWLARDQDGEWNIQH